MKNTMLRSMNQKQITIVKESQQVQLKLQHII